MQWKKLFTHLGIVIAILAVFFGLRFLIRGMEAEAAAKELPAIAPIPSGVPVGVTILTEVKLNGSPSVGIVYATKKDKNLIPITCSTTQGKNKQTGCNFRHRLNGNEGDQITIEVYRAFALANAEQRLMLRRIYDLPKKGNAITNDPFTDPKGFGNGTVTIQSGEPFPEKK